MQRFVGPTFSSGEKHVAFRPLRLPVSAELRSVCSCVLWSRRSPSVERRFLSAQPRRRNALQMRCQSGESPIHQDLRVSENLEVQRIHRHSELRQLRLEVRAVNRRGLRRFVPSAGAVMHTCSCDESGNIPAELSGDQSQGRSNLHMQTANC